MLKIAINKNLKKNQLNIILPSIFELMYTQEQLQQLA